MGVVGETPVLAPCAVQQTAEKVEPENGAAAAQAVTAALGAGAAVAAGGNGQAAGEPAPAGCPCADVLSRFWQLLIRALVTSCATWRR